MSNTQPELSQKTDQSSQMSFLKNEASPTHATKISTIEILPELKNWLFPLASEEYENLKADILRNGIREPLSIWVYQGRRILADGHNRHQIALEFKVPYKELELRFDCIDEVKEWMDSNQTARRNTSREQQAYYVGRRYDMGKKNKESNLSIGKNFTLEGQAENLTERTSVKIADGLNLSEKTVRNYHLFFLGVERIKLVNSDLAMGFLAGAAPMEIAMKYANKEVPNVTTYKELIAGLKKNSGIKSKSKTKLTSKPTSEPVDPMQPFKDIMETRLRILFKQIIKKYSPDNHDQILDILDELYKLSLKEWVPADGTLNIQALNDRIFQSILPKLTETNFAVWKEVEGELAKIKTYEEFKVYKEKIALTGKRICDKPVSTGSTQP